MSGSSLKPKEAASLSDNRPWKAKYPVPFDSALIPDPVVGTPSEMRSGLRKPIWHLIKGFMRLFFRADAIGVQHLPDEGPVIVISEHRSLLDIPLIHLTNRKWIHWLAKVELFKNRFGFHFLPWWGAVSVDRDQLGSRTVREVLGLLKQRKIIGIFPQGSRCKTEEKIRATEPKPGVARFALKAKARILPVAIDGQYKLFRKTRAVYGKLMEIRLPEGQNRLRPEDERALMLQMMRAIYALKGEDYLFQYPEDVPVSETQFLFPVE